MQADRKAGASGVKRQNRALAAESRKASGTAGRPTAKRCASSGFIATSCGRTKPLRDRMKSVARSTTPFLTATGRSLFSAPSGKTACCKDRSFVSASKMKRFLSPCKTVQLFSPAVVPDYACHAPHSADVMMAMIMGVRVPAVPDRRRDFGIAFPVDEHRPRRGAGCGTGGAGHRPQATCPGPGPGLRRMGRRAGFSTWPKPADASGLFRQASLPRQSIRGIAVAWRSCRDTGRPVRCGGPAAWDHRTRVPAPCGAIKGGHSPERRGCMALPTAPRAAGFGRAPFPFDTRSGQPATAGADLRKGASLRLPGC